MKIDCIAIPTTTHEWGDLAVLFACWNLLHNGTPISERLVITYPGEFDSSTHAKAQSLIKIFQIDVLFPQIEIVFLSIPMEEDIYIKHGQEWTGPVPRLGLKSGPNAQFFKTIKYLNSSHFTLLNETDVFPLKSSWLVDLSSTLRPNHDWVLGSHYRGEAALGPDIINHINGAAVYSTGNKEFQCFCADYWEPGVAEMCKELPDTAYDIWLSRLQHSFSANPSLWTELDITFKKLFSNALAKFSVTDQIANLTLLSDYRSLDELVSEGFSLVHGKHFRINALANALHYAKTTYQYTLTKLQEFALLSRTKNNPDIVALLNSTASASLTLRAHQLIEKRARNAEKRLLAKANIRYSFTAVANSDACLSSRISLLAKEKPSTLIAFSPYKAGSTLLFTGLELMQAPFFLGKEYVSYYDHHFLDKGTTNDESMVRYLLEKASNNTLFEPSKIYAGFRDCIPFTSEFTKRNHIDIFSSLAASAVPAHFVFLLRDPRDCLVSLYYSHKKSHRITTSDSILVKARDEAHSLSINEYTLANLTDVKGNTSRMLALIDGCRYHNMPHTVFAYEEIYSQQHAMFDNIANVFGKRLNDEMWLELISRSQKVSDTPLGYQPSEENSSKHIRQGSPGDHREKLSPKVIKECEIVFRDELNLLQSLNKDYQY